MTTVRFRLSTLSIVLALVVWELAAVWIVRDTVLLPSPVATVHTLIRYFSMPYPADGETLIGHTLTSTARILAGFALGTLAGILLGSLMAALPPFRAMVDPFIELTRPLPPLAFIPVLI